MEGKVTFSLHDKCEIIESITEEIEEFMLWMGSFGKQEEGGVTRLLYSEAWRDAQLALAAAMEQAGLEASFDWVGNLFGKLPGTETNKTSIMTGSHVDTVKNGGMYDGTFGIAAGVIALKYLKQHFGMPKRSLEVVSLCEEEGSRFPMTYWGSGSITGRRHVEEIALLTDENGISFREAMEAAGFGSGTLRDSRRQDIGAFIELHVEQGIVLERNNLNIGIVEAIVGQRRYTIEVTGEANHAGTTPMMWRKDALGGASGMTQYLLNAAREQGAPLVATVGRFEVKPNVANVIPEKVIFTVDVRHPDATVLETFCHRFLTEFRKIAEEQELHVQTHLWMNASPVNMDKELSAKIERICKSHDISHLSMASGAGHDAQMFQHICPSALIFVPSHLGISHSPQEYTSPADLAVGTAVLIELLYLLGYKEEEI
ncbi:MULTISPECIES: allantoate deiminase [unclassified Paenibacillus]|uniref:allantoate deiminase n=1 Tax=unclassified Paenibacillus TaxID=185978 RepID=UPI00114338D9|nr:allantoate deiminase [Paenibacillus sp. tmac-D7]